MKYLCLVYFEPKIWDTMSKSENEALDKDSLAYDEKLQQSGHYLTAEALQSVNTATTVRMRNGKISTTDGPFSETKEVLGGFILINASDLNDAIQVAGHIPLARYGSVEVRPIYDIPVH
jgi:hypothetical protein